MKPIVRLDLPPQALQFLAGTVPQNFISFPFFLSKTTAQIIASSTHMRYSAGDSDVCVKMTLRTHF